MKLFWESSFKHAFKRRTRNRPDLKEKVFATIEELIDDPYKPSLKTHKLSGQLQGLWACWVEYDCRIIFTFFPHPQTGEETIALIDLGSHNEVY